MPDFNSLKDLYLVELQETRSVEEQLNKALPLLAEMADDTALKDAILQHLGETRTQLERLADMLNRHGVAPNEHRDQSMQTLIGEARKWLAMLDDPAARDAALVASAQRIEHYEIAIYGSLAAWAKKLGFHEDLETLLTILDEERRADATLTDLAKDRVNAAAA